MSVIYPIGVGLERIFPYEIVIASSGTKISTNSIWIKHLKRSHEYVYHHI
jgi:hypothetical protein